MKIAAAVNVLTSLCETKNKRKCQIKCEVKYNYVYIQIKNKASLRVHQSVNSPPLVLPLSLQQTQESPNLFERAKGVFVFIIFTPKHTLRLRKIAAS